MAGFCGYCGKKMDGETCGCRDPISAPAPAQHTPPPSPNYIPAAPPPPAPDAQAYTAPPQAYTPPAPPPQAYTPPTPPPSPTYTPPTPPPPTYAPPAPPPAPNAPAYAAPPPPPPPSPPLQSPVSPQQNYIPAAQQPPPPNAPAYAASPPKPRIFCQGCGAELADGVTFCQVCGFKAPGGGFRSFGGGNTMSSGGVNMQAASDFVSGLPAKTGISLQRLVLMAASALGILFGLIPRYTFSSFVSGLLAMAGESSKPPGYSAFGWISTVVFAVSLALCFLGDRARPVGKLKAAFIATGGFNLLLGILQFVIFNSGDYKVLSQYGMGGIGFGLYLLVLMSIVVAAIPFIKQLEK